MYPKRSYKIELLVKIVEDGAYEINKEINFVVDTLNDAHQDKMKIKIRKIEQC